MTTRATLTLKPNVPKKVLGSETQEFNSALEQEQKVAAPNFDHKKIHNAKIQKLNREYKEIFTLLSTNYPNCFNHDKKPLAIGIHKELIQLHPTILSKQRVFRFLQRYCNGFYKKGLVIGAIRLNLDGSKSSIVTETEIDYAN